MSRKIVLFGLAISATVVFAIYMRFLGDEGVTPLMVAAKTGDTEALNALVSEGVDLNRTSDYGWTAMMFAAWQGHEEAVRALVESGADTDVVSGAVPANFLTTGDYPPTTALFEAISHRHLHVAEYLLENGARVDPAALAMAGWRGTPRLLAEMIEKGGQINEVSDNPYYRTALSVAARYGNDRNVRWLLSNGADPNLSLPHSSNLQAAVSGLSPESVSLLIGSGADVNAPIGSTKTSALREAVYVFANNRHAEKVRIVELLLANGADPSHMRDQWDDTLIEHVELRLQRSIESSLDPEFSQEVRDRHRRSLEADQAILELLKAYGH